MITKCLYWFLKFIHSVKGGLDKFYINIYTFLCMMITKCSHTNYDGTQQFLKFI